MDSNLWTALFEQPHIEEMETARLEVHYLALVPGPFFKPF